MLTAEAIELLTDRKLDPEVAERLGLGVFVGRDDEPVGIVFPYRVDGVTVNNKYRTFEKRFWQEAGGTKCLWNFDAIALDVHEELPLVITEGEFDAIAAIQCGFHRTVSVPDGAPKKAIDNEDTVKFTYLDHADKVLNDVDEIILATDGDQAGVILREELAKRLGKRRCKWIAYPYNRARTKRLKDLNEVLVVWGPNGVNETLKRAQWCQIDGVYRMGQLPDLPVKPRFSTGIRALDPHWMVRPGDFTVLGGIPGHGKGAFINDITCRMVDLHNIKVTIASLENQPQTDYRRMLREWHAAMPMRQMNKEMIDLADAWIDAKFSFIVPNEDELADLPWFLDKMATAATRFDASMCILDPWNEVDHDKPRDMSVTDYINFAVKELKRVNRKFNLHTIVAVHPVKMTQVNGSPIKPGLYDLADSAAWRNKPDVGLIIHKPDIKGYKAILDVEKSRHWDEIGTPGQVEMNYDPFTRRYSPIHGNGSLPD